MTPIVSLSMLAVTSHRPSGEIASWLEEPAWRVIPAEKAMTVQKNRPVQILHIFLHISPMGFTVNRLDSGRNLELTESCRNFGPAGV